MIVMIMDGIGDKNGELRMMMVILIMDEIDDGG